MTLATNESGGCFRRRATMFGPAARPAISRPDPFKEDPVMLVLSRKVNEKLVIGDNITVVVSRVAGNRVTLGIEAPHDVRIVRGELHFDVEDAAPSTRSVGGFHAEEDTLTASVPRLAK